MPLVGDWGAGRVQGGSDADAMHVEERHLLERQLDVHLSRRWQGIAHSRGDLGFESLIAESIDIKGDKVLTADLDCLPRQARRHAGRQRTRRNPDVLGSDTN